MNWGNIVMLVVSAAIFGCGASSANQETVQSVEELPPLELTAALDAVWLPAEELTTPEQIDAWANGVNKLQNENQLEVKGPYTIIRDGKGYEVTASLVEGEIVQLYAQVGDGSEQYWYYLNQYDIPTLREISRKEGTYYERRFYYTIYNDEKKLLKAVERRADQRQGLTAAGYVLYQPVEENDFRLDPLAVRNSAISFIQGK